MKSIPIFFWNDDLGNLPAESAMQSLVFEYNDKQDDYLFQFLGLPFKEGVEGYGFAIADEKKNKAFIFKTLPKTSTIDELKSVLDDILSGRFKYVEDDFGSGNYRSNWIEVPWSGSPDSEGGVIPLDLLPESVRKLLDTIFGALGLDKLKISHWLYAALAVYATTKVLQKNSNKYLWGSLAVFTTYTAIKKYNDSKKEINTV